MESKIALEGILWDLKVMSDLCLRGSIESGTKKINETFKNALNTSLNIQNKIYNLMAEKGWYTTDVADQSKIEQEKQKCQN